MSRVWHVLKSVTLTAIVGGVSSTTPINATGNYACTAHQRSWVNKPYSLLSNVKSIREG